MNETLVLAGVTRRYQSGDATLTVLNAVDFTLYAGEMVALVAPSGSGKSTLLHLAGLLEYPDSGTITIAGQNTNTLPDRARTALRRDRIGFVYQFHHLLAEFTAEENVALPHLIAGRSKQAAKLRAQTLLAALGLEARRHHLPGKLSGGEQQRVAIARALANHPCLLLADEPTGNLDAETAETVFDQLLTLVRREQVAALIATHNPALASRMDRTVTLRNQGLVAA